jgi:hypothetical protein
MIMFFLFLKQESGVRVSPHCSIEISPFNRSYLTEYIFSGINEKDFQIKFCNYLAKKQNYCKAMYHKSESSEYRES